MQKDREKQQLYEEYVKKVTPTHSLPANMVKAFLVGGLICVSGQAVTEWALAAGMDEKTAGTWCSIALIFLSALTTGMNPLSTAGKMGRSRHPCADHRICQFCGGHRQWNTRKKDRYLESEARYLP